MQYARIVDGIVVEIITPPAGFALADSLHPTLAAQCLPLPEGIVVGASYDAVADAWTNPPAPSTDPAAESTGDAAPVVEK